MRVPTTRAWVTIASLMVFIGTVNTLVVQRHPAATLTIDMQSNVTSHAKVFFDTGQGFNESESDLRWVTGDRDSHRLVFPFPSKTVRNIRFDPIETSGVVEVRSAVIERPRSHEIIRKVDVTRILPLHEIASISPHDGAVRVTTLEEANDSQLLLPIETPVTAYYSSAQLFSWKVLRLDALSLLVALGLLAAVRYRRRWWPLLGAIHKRFDAYSARLRRPGLFEIDRTALWYYLLCLTAFVALSLAKLHGSSISIAGASYRGWTDVEHTPLLGTPKKVRSDEWSFQTPTILNQVYRRDQFGVNDTLLGPGKAALLGNVPCWHFTQLFRPQFWAFFVLPADMAFSVYWQCKALLLLTGVFTLLLMVTRSSASAAVCALWFFLSAYTQWTYSWASLLPEMVGLFCWVISLTCYLTVGRNRLFLIIAAIICTGCAINFALCAYPPQQLPLVVFGLAIIAGWLWSHWDSVWHHPARATRLLALVGCWFVVGGVMIWFYVDARETLLAAAATIYPGQRSSSGGGIPIAQFVSHFFDFWKSEDNFPASQGNICEASGYLWLAPVTLLLARPPKKHRHSTALLVSFWLAFLFLLSWMLFPIPAAVARWFFFDRVPPFRCFPALGLINIAIVGFFVAERKGVRTSDYLRGFTAAVLLVLLFLTMNQKLGDFFSMWAIAIAGFYICLLILFLVLARRKAFAAFLLIPLAFTNGLINPIDRGLEVITASSLFKAAHGDHDNWRDGKWLIYAPWADEPGLLAATGIDVVDCLKIVPDRKRLGGFDSDNRYAQVINRSSYFFALPLGPGQPSSFESPSPGNVLWRVNPLDSRLRLIGVDRIAFAYQPPSAELRQALAPLLEETLPGLKVYHLR